MDPKQQLNQLDPKLKEAYERVMGTIPTTSSAPVANASTSVQAPLTPPSPTTPTPPPPTPSASSTSTSNVADANVVAASVMAPTQPQLAVSSSTTPNAPVESLHATVSVSTTPQHASTSVHGFIAPKKKSPVSTPLVLVGGFVLLLVYALFWIKFFNVPLPFTSQ